MVQKSGKIPPFGSLMESVMICKTMMDRDYMYLAPAVASGVIDMKKGLEALKNAVFRDVAIESKNIFKKMENAMKKIKKFKFFARFKDE